MYRSWMVEWLDGNITSFRSWFVQQRRRERRRQRVIAKTTAAAVSSGLQCIITVHSPSSREREERGRRRSLQAKYETPLLSRHEAYSRGEHEWEREFLSCWNFFVQAMHHIYTNISTYMSLMQMLTRTPTCDHWTLNHPLSGLSQVIHQMAIGPAHMNHVQQNSS